ncbi:unnamed protein product [Nyctereutes procyonoides]|uniref:(raccoon dog) hypothetical protein n=1 Tax=Nyctereutes procyonoides TaxID=34880 RepID=A0A811ZK12_NYCPR|nr:unnamed protein product [Nyctereutes procyonoides]
MRKIPTGQGQPMARRYVAQIGSHQWVTAFSKRYGERERERERGEGERERERERDREREWGRIEEKRKHFQLKSPFLLYSVYLSLWSTINSSKALLPSSQPLQSLSRARIPVRLLFSSFSTTRHKPKQPAAELLNIAAAEISSGLDEEPLQMSPNFSNFLFYRIKNLKMESHPSPASSTDARGRAQRGKPRALGAVGIGRQPLQDRCCPCVRCCQGRKWERHRSAALPGQYHGDVTQWQSPTPFWKVLVQPLSTFLGLALLRWGLPVLSADALVTCYLLCEAVWAIGVGRGNPGCPFALPWLSVPNSHPPRGLGWASGKNQHTYSLT